MNRRRFLGALTAMGIGGAGGGLAGAGRAMASPAPRRDPLGGGRRYPDRWGVQLYTIRDRMAEDVKGTLHAVADLGYGEVEFAGLYDWTPAHMRTLLDDLGLRAASSHVGMNVIRGEWEAELDGAVALGQDLIVLPSLPPDARSDDGLRALADELNRAGEVAKARGISLGFHNHDFEVRPLPETGAPGTPERPLDILLDRTDPELVSFQLDLFWTVHGGADPEAYFRTHRGRFYSVHAKDRTASGDMVPVGQGAMDFASLLRVGERVGGVRHVFVEHDRPQDSMESIRTSIEHLNSLRG